tara:strand:+ start:857 stop:2206 length:1350 start_codon:yes stop_codon:yes gene_type:complete
MSTVKELDENKMLFNSGSAELSLDMGKLIDDDKEGIEFRSLVDLTDMYTNMIISQSIFDPYMTLSIHISESKLVFEEFGTKGLQGEEFILIKFQTPTKKIIEDLFYVTGYSPVKKDQRGLSTSMVLNCVSKEKLINDQITVNQSFAGSTSDIAKNIYNNFIIGSEKFKQFKSANKDGQPIWKEKPIIVDESIGTQKFIIPGLTPFKALHFLAVRSFGGSGFPSSFYTFYEGDDAFHFKNIENWSDNVKEKAYTFDSDVAALPQNDKLFYQNIKHMSPMAINNTMQGIQKGEYATQVSAVDFNKKSYTITNFDMIKERDNFNTLGEHFNMSSAFFDMFGNDPTETTIAIDSTKGSFNENLPGIQTKRKSYMEMLGHYSMIVSIHGDSSLVPGTVIQINLKESGAPERKTQGSMYSGNWYVTKVEHIYDKTIFNTKLTVVKDGLDFEHGEK